VAREPEIDRTTGLERRFDDIDIVKILGINNQEKKAGAHPARPTHFDDIFLGFQHLAP